MDSLQGIPVEYKLDTFNMPHTGTTLCHPKIGYVNAMLLFRSRHLAINSPLGHFNGDNAYSPPQKYQTHETHGDIQSSFPPTATWLSLNYSEHNPSHVRRHAQPSQPFHKSISSQYSHPFHESCSTKSKPNIPCCKSNLFLKTHFDYRHLTSSSFL